MQDASAAPSIKNARTNRLIDSTSPYLLQHAHNPVDWYPWGPEAIESAKRENKPIFLSIGYSACHWCHVMEREVFEKQDIANIMNQYFVNIKVDREERPDLDEIYMLATQITSGSGGWPMSVWLTPDLEPFYAGTYFPPTDGYGRPGFPRLELALAEMWEKERPKLLEQARRVAEGVRLHADEMAGATDGRIDLQLWLGVAVEQFADRFDPQNGGLGTAPKFPPSQAIPLWLALSNHHQHAPLFPENADIVLRQMTIKTLDAMARGGIYDQIAGGFSRYSTDEHWLVPHFEKMLYDNAQLAPAYAVASLQLARPEYARIARQTLDFFLREMCSPLGAFYSTLDADSEGHEGKYYLWTIDEVRQTLAHPDDSALIIKHFGLTAEGNFEGKNILFVAHGVEELAAELHTTPHELQKRIDRLCVKLRTARAQRIMPGLDDKILTGWNGLMISALAICGRLLREPRYLEAAHRAVGFLLLKHMRAGQLLRTSRAGNAHLPAFLEDHAYLLNALMDIIQSTSETSLAGAMARRRAQEMADQMIELFHDPVGQGFFFTHDGHEKLFARTKNGTDNATPSASAVAIRALLRLARVSGKSRYRDLAINAVKRFAAVIAKQPSMFATILLALVEDAQPAAPAADHTPPPPAGVQGDAATPVRAAAATRPAAGPLRLEAAAVAAKAGEYVEIPLILHVDAGYHVQSSQAIGRETFATSAQLRTALPLNVTQWIYPPVRQFGVGPEAIDGYAGAVVITAQCKLPRTAPIGRHTLRATVTAQPCNQTSCLPPEQLTIEIPIDVLEPA